MDAHSFLPPVIQFYRDRRRMPSVQELTTLYGFRSKNAAFKVVTKLLAAGLVLLPVPLLISSQMVAITGRQP